MDTIISYAVAYDIYIIFVLCFVKYFVDFKTPNHIDLYFESSLLKFMVFEYPFRIKTLSTPNFITSFA